jgi:carbon storage regulator CsrA
MLVLSRRPGQKIVFPGLGISIEVLQSKGTVTKLGIEAPVEIEVYRHEVLEKSDPREVLSTGAASSSRIQISETEREQRHRLNNKLNALTLKLQLLQKQLARGVAVEPDAQLADVVGQLSELEMKTPDCSVTEKSPRVLIVEDQANERELLANCLKLSGVPVATAVNGLDAFNYLHENEMPDLVLLDMRMPEIDGPSFIRMIRDDIRLRSLKVFAVSGSAREEFSSALAVDGWFSKPVRIDSLLEALRDPACCTMTPA